MFALVMLAFAMSTADANTITVPEVVISAPAPKGTERWMCENDWHDLQSSTGQYKNCANFFADGKGNWVR